MDFILYIECCNSVAVREISGLRAKCGKLIQGYESEIALYKSLRIFILNVYLREIIKL